MPRAAEAARYFREQAHGQGWDRDRTTCSTASRFTSPRRTKRRWKTWSASGAGTRRGSFATNNRVLDEAAASAGYYGRDTENQRARLQVLDLETRIEQGQLLAGGPDRVLEQIRWVRDELKAGIVDLIFAPVGRDKTLRAIELFGKEVLPRMKEL